MLSTSHSNLFSDCGRSCETFFGNLSGHILVPLCGGQRLWIDLASHHSFFAAAGLTSRNHFSTASTTHLSLHYFHPSERQCKKVLLYNCRKNRPVSLNRILSRIVEPLLHQRMPEFLLIQNVILIVQHSLLNSHTIKTGQYHLRPSLRERRTSDNPLQPLISRWTRLFTSSCTVDYRPSQADVLSTVPPLPWRISYLSNFHQKFLLSVRPRIPSLQPVALYDRACPDCKTDSLKVDLVLGLLALNRCDHFCVTVTRPFTIEIVETFTLDLYVKGTVGSSRRLSTFLQEPASWACVGMGPSDDRSGHSTFD